MSLNKTQNNTCFGPGVFERILSEQPSLPVSINFSDEIIGRTTAFRKEEGNRIVVEFECGLSHLDELRLFAVPMGIVKTTDLKKSGDGVLIIENMQLISIGLTPTPADDTLKLIERGE
jgi:hypothetical protein